MIQHMHLHNDINFNSFKHYLKSAPVHLLKTSFDRIKSMKIMKKKNIDEEMKLDRYKMNPEWGRRAKQSK